MPRQSHPDPTSHPHPTPGSKPTASFPTTKWDGSTPTRKSMDTTREPGPEDFQQVVSEVQAVQDMLLNSTSWQTLTLAGGWTGSASVRVEGKKVHLKGIINPGTITDATTIFTLPAGSRPAAKVSQMVAPSDTSPYSAGMRVVIDTAGVTKVYGIGGSVTAVDLSGVKFFTD
jgi:hypothetical protein